MNLILRAQNFYREGAPVGGSGGRGGNSKWADIANNINNKLKCLLINQYMAPQRRTLMEVLLELIVDNEHGSKGS